jgi:23S rRNA (adenine1618-N6)-methyltransferase
MERKPHPRNKYGEKPPDFNLLAGLYPQFKEYVTYGSNQKPRIDWTDFNATRELTRSLLHHDYGISWSDFFSVPWGGFSV